jgi:hypothetical protein
MNAHDLKKLLPADAGGSFDEHQKCPRATWDRRGPARRCSSMQHEPICACGCGAATKLGNRFVHGHNRRGDIKPVRYVEEDRGYLTPCWIWQLSVTRAGYGSIGGSREGTKLAHRVYYEQAHGPVPEGLELDHLCRVPVCCNPDHLEAVTHAENVRRGHTGRPRTITDEQIGRMRDLDAAGVLRRDIAAEFCVSPASVTRLLGRKAA